MASPSYNAISFEIFLDDSWTPIWARQASLVRTVIPGANKEIVQSAGMGNRRIQVIADFDSLNDLQNLQAWVGSDLRTLTNFLGESSISAMLTSVEPRGKVYGQSHWRARLEFERFS